VRVPRTCKGVVAGFRGRSIGVVRERKIPVIAPCAAAATRRSPIDTNLRYWFHKCFLRKSDFDSDDLGRSRVIRPLGCRRKRAPTWRDRNARLSSLPVIGGASWRVDRFHPHLSTGVSGFVHLAGSIYVISPSHCGRSNSTFFWLSTKPNLLICAILTLPGEG